MTALRDLKVVELGGIGPGPFCGMLLADMGADVLRIERTQPSGLGVDIPPKFDLMNRNKQSVAIDLKVPEGRDIALSLIEKADALIEGFRPGTMERLGLGPEVFHSRNERLIYARITGWGQDGPLANSAGHDLNYIALTGALHAIGYRDREPVPPLSLVGDYAGGGLYGAFGILCALHEAQRSGKGQIVDAAMIDGAATLMISFLGMRQMGYWTNERGRNISDGGAHFYGCYETLDGRFVAIAAVEPKFYQQLLDLIGVREADLPDQNDRNGWQLARRALETVFRGRTRDEWCRILEGSDACFAPVLDMDEAPDHPHHRARGAFMTVDGVVQPAPGPRLNRTPGTLRRAPGQSSDVGLVLSEWGIDMKQIDSARGAKALAQGTI